MTLIPVPVAPYNADTSVSGITCQKGNVAPNFNHVDLRNITVALTTLLILPDADAGANGVT